MVGRRATSRARLRMESTHRLPYNEFSNDICSMRDFDGAKYEDTYEGSIGRRDGGIGVFVAEAPTQAEACSTAPRSVGMTEEILYTVYHWEGGDTLTDHPSDKGGVTKFGISQKYHPDVDVANLTPTQAMSLYIEEYWNPMRCSELHSKRVRWKVFDTAVMFGVKRATQMLQDIVDVDRDGKMGPRTLAKLNAMPEDTLLAEIAFAQIRSRAAAVVADSSQIAFLVGWINRAQDMGYAVEEPR